MTSCVSVCVCECVCVSNVPVALEDLVAGSAAADLVVVGSVVVDLVVAATGIRIGMGI